MHLRVDNVSLSYGKVQVVSEVSLSVAPREIVTILGVNGAGKSTLLKSISGLMKPASGAIWWSDTRIDSMSPDERIRLGIVHVSEGHHVFPYMTVYENLKMGAFARRDSSREVEQSTDELFDLFPLLARKKSAKAGTLSGGLKQMLCIARGLMSKPTLLLLDEPSQGLAPLVVKEIADFIRSLNKTGLTVIVVEQNIHLALGLANKVYILEGGHIVYEGGPKDYTEDEYVQKVYLGRW